jgi:hypothetical protein
MGLVRNLKKTLNNLVEKILVELSYHYIKQKAKQISKKPDNYSSTESSQSHLTREYQHSTIATSSTGTSEKTIMMETEEIVDHVRTWALDRIESYDSKEVEHIYNQMAIIDEYREWLTPKEDELEIVSLDEISEEEYNNFVDGIERA